MLEQYADGLVQVSVSGAVVRIDLGTQPLIGEDAQAQQPQQDENETPPLVPRVRIIMPVDGFGQTFGVLEQVIQQLVSDGVLSRLDPRDAQHRGTGGGEGSGQGGSRSTGKSPNFPS